MYILAIGMFMLQIQQIAYWSDYYGKFELEVCTFLIIEPSVIQTGETTVLLEYFTESVRSSCVCMGFCYQGQSVIEGPLYIAFIY